MARTVNRPVYNLLITKQSQIVDTINLTSEYQKEFLDAVARDLWINRQLYGKEWLLIVLEELELYARNLRGSASQHSTINNLPLDKKNP